MSCKHSCLQLKIYQNLFDLVLIINLAKCQHNRLAAICFRSRKPRLTTAAKLKDARKSALVLIKNTIDIRAARNENCCISILAS